MAMDPWNLHVRTCTCMYMHVHVHTIACACTCTCSNSASTGTLHLCRQTVFSDLIAVCRSHVHV